jgi:hypothetical protein
MVSVAVQRERVICAMSSMSPSVQLRSVRALLVAKMHSLAIPDADVPAWMRRSVGKLVLVLAERAIRIVA